MKVIRIIFLLLSVWVSLESTQVIKKTDPSVKAIIFDCDGTLVDNGIGHYLDWHWALQCQGYELSADTFWSFMDAHQLVGAPGADKLIAKFCCELLGRDCTNELMRDAAAFSAQLHANGFPPIESTLNFLHRLVKEKAHFGYKLGLASGATKEGIILKLKSLGIAECFDVIVSGADDLAEYNDPEGTNKPKPYIYLHAAKLLGLLPEQCVAIEDSRTGVSSAVNAGCIVIAIPNAYTTQHDLSHAHLKIASFLGVSPEDFLYMIADRCRDHACTHVSHLQSVALISN